MYFTRDVFGNADMYSLIAIISILVAVIVMAFAPKMFQKHGKRNVLLVFAVIGIVGGILGYVGAKSLNEILVFVSTALHGASLAPFVAAIFTFASDIIDYLELKTGESFLVLRAEKSSFLQILLISLSKLVRRQPEHLFEAADELTRVLVADLFADLLQLPVFGF